MSNPHQQDAVIAAFAQDHPRISVCVLMLEKNVTHQVA